MMIANVSGYGLGFTSMGSMPMGAVDPEKWEHNKTWSITYRDECDGYADSIKHNFEMILGNHPLS